LNKPFVSIITVCFNEEHRIETTIKSVLNQTFKNYEFIVVDGASKDKTINIISNYIEHIDSFISEPDDGLYHAMNKGASCATGDYLFFLNAGDFFLNDNTLESIFLYNPKADFVYGDIKIQKLSGEKVTKHMPVSLSKQFILQKTLPHQSVFTKKELFELIGGYDINLKIASDYKFQLIAILQKKATTQHIPVIFTLYDRSGISYLNPELKEKEKTLVRKQTLNQYSLFMYSFNRLIFRIKTWIN